jgi:hypothetical protein
MGECVIKYYLIWDLFRKNTLTDSAIYSPQEGRYYSWLEIKQLKEYRYELEKQKEIAKQEEELLQQIASN